MRFVSHSSGPIDSALFFVFALWECRFPGSLSAVHFVYSSMNRKSNEMDVQQTSESNTTYYLITLSGRRIVQANPEK